MHFIIDSETRPYLEVQCGDIANYLGTVMWKEAYDDRIERVYRSMLSALPKKCESILDIGGGMSGIGARLCEHYGGEPLIAVLDGKNSLAVVDKHREPFNNATQTFRFLKANGVKKQTFYAPDEEIDQTFDLVISTQAWCFHIAPEVYLDKVSKALGSRGAVIVDWRAEKYEWLEQLRNAFGIELSLIGTTKWQRLAFRRGEAC